MRVDENIFIIGEEVAEYQGAYKVTQGLLQEFGPKRVIDSPITEHGFAGIAVGAAMSGLRPIVEFMTFNFAMQAIDQIINSAAKTNYMSGGGVGCPIVFRGPNGSASRVGAQHSQCFASWYAHCPGLIVISPYSAADSKKLLKLAIKNNNPVIFLEHELMYGKSFDTAESDVEIGKAVVTQTGDDVTIVGFSWMMEKIYEAAIILREQHGINPEIIDLLTIKPLDIDTVITSVKKTNRLVCVEEGWGFAGIGSEIAYLIGEAAFDYLDSPVARVCAVDTPLPYAKNLEIAAIPSTQKIVEQVLKVCYK
jgi:pyruvate dehydrogenase E1 component beta subunit